ncbi:M18 family aminopeptidase [Glutamicibacter soli]|uniref:M18 family aminopeptidase n=2 Tax=Glutamicibacter soli TaxID=453836 RepID=A0A365YEG3_9MICC|nr:M18 family aminopeptidase [Glutamicibacter soli]
MAQAAAMAHIADLAEYVATSPSSYHAAASAAKRLDAAGFTALDEAEAWALGAGSYYVVRDGAVIAWVQPEGATATSGFRILGAHTDSPGFKLKPKPTTGSNGWWQAGVEVYGGPLLNSWLDRELVLAGRLVLRDGSVHLAQTEPLLRIPQLAIHLDRQVNDGLTLDRQAHTNPIFGAGDLADADILAVLAASAGVDPSQIAGYDVLTAPAQRGEVFGEGKNFFASSRLDNLSSVHAGLVALTDYARKPEGHRIAMLAAFDHEELGSESRSGASGPFLEELLQRIQASFGATVEDTARALANSVCLSADAGHAVHPNYAERHDPANRPQVNAGPLLKINANQRYATDAVGAAAFAGWCDTAGVPYQEFVSNNRVPCGSTIGPLTATRIGIRTVDVGVALLSMHSAREMCGVDDPWYLSKVARVFFGE